MEAELVLIGGEMAAAEFKRDPAVIAIQRGWHLMAEMLAELAEIAQRRFGRDARG